MFWGLNLKPNRKYSQTSSKAFHISQAALDTTSCGDGPQQIFVTCENQRFLLCTLRKDACDQAVLDLNFLEGEDICFHTIGSGNVSLSGYLIEDDSMDQILNGGEEDESATEMEDLRNTLNRKSKAAAKAAIPEDGDDDEDESDDSDFNEEALLDGQADSDDDEEDDSDDEEDDDDDDDEEADEDDEEEDDSEDEEVQEPKSKQPKLEKAQKKEQPQNGVAKAKEQKKGKDKKQQPEKKQPQENKQKQAGGERVLSGGVKVEDIRVGNGAEAKTGKRAKVYYEGRLKSNNKVFDSLKQGNGFAFGIGRGEVIKGWDVGVAGMKVGGRRRITCPPHMAYGARGSPPTIPPNSTLVFEVELKSVN